MRSPMRALVCQLNLSSEELSHEQSLGKVPLEGDSSQLQLVDPATSVLFRISGQAKGRGLMAKPTGVLWETSALEIFFVRGSKRSLSVLL